MSGNELYYQLEERSSDINLKRFQSFIDEFYSAIGHNLDSLVVGDIGTDEPTEKFYYLRYLVSTYLKKYINVFYEVLEKCGYNLKSEIIDNMKILGKETNIKYAFDVIEYVKLNPYVDDVIVSGEQIIVKSEKLGDQIFMGVKNYLSNNRGALRIVSGKIDHMCHTISTQLLDEIEDAKIVTSLLPSYFEGTYFHSYIVDKDDNVIDAINQIVMTRSDYEKLFEPEVVCELDKESLYKEYISAVKGGNICENDGFYMPVAVALDKRLSLGGR